MKPISCLLLDLLLNCGFEYSNSNQKIPLTMLPLYSFGFCLSPAFSIRHLFSYSFAKSLRLCSAFGLIWNWVPQSVSAWVCVFSHYERISRTPKNLKWNFFTYQSYFRVPSSTSLATYLSFLFHAAVPHFLISWHTRWYRRPAIEVLWLFFGLNSRTDSKCNHR